MRDNLSCAHLEEAALNAWPAPEQVLYDGWVLRFAKGYTKRANSVNVIAPSAIPINTKVEACERLYADKGLPPVFRLTSFNAPPGLDLLLERRGYGLSDRFHVLTLDMTEWNIAQRQDVTVLEEEPEGWLDMHSRLSGIPSEYRQVHGEILAAIAARRYLLSLSAGGRTVACGLGVQEQEYFGLFDLVTDAQERSKGYGTQLIAGLLARAVAGGARFAYLQVSGGNRGARRLYGRLGFREAYHYWYRVGSAPFNNR